MCVCVGKVWSFLSPLARVFEAQLSSLPQHVVPRTVPTRRHQLTEIALPDGCRVPYGGGLRRAQQVSSHPRADCCYARRVRRRSSSSRGSNARRPSSPPSSTTRRPLLSPVLGRAAAARCRVGGALPMTNIRLTVQHGCSTPSRALRRPRASDQTRYGVAISGPCTSERIKQIQTASCTSKYGLHTPDLSAQRGNLFVWAVFDRAS